MLPIRRIYGFGGLRIIASYDPTTSDSSKIGLSPRPMKNLILDTGSSIKETYSQQKVSS